GQLTGDPSSFITDVASPAAGRPTIYVVGGRNTSATYPGTIEDFKRNTGITKVGMGSWTLTGYLSYSGNTTVSNGALIVQAPGFLQASSNIIVGAGALLDV